MTVICPLDGGLGTVARAKSVLLTVAGAAVSVLLCVGQAGDRSGNDLQGRGGRTTVVAVLSGTVLGRARLPDGGAAPRVLRLAVKGQEVRAGEALAAVRTRFGLSVAARSPMSGTVVRVHVAVGSRVAVGEPLFTLDPY